jgi:hypothetical protein
MALYTSIPAISAFAGESGSYQANANGVFDLVDNAPFVLAAMMGLQLVPYVTPEEVAATADAQAVVTTKGRAKAKPEADPAT